MESFDLLSDVINSVEQLEIDLKEEEPQEEDHETKTCYILTPDNQQVAVESCWCQAIEVMHRIPIGKSPAFEEQHVLFKDEEYKMVYLPTSKGNVNKQASALANKDILGPVMLWKL